MLTNAAVKAARTRASAYKLSDGRGLILFVAASGLRSWRWRFTWNGKEQLLTLGSYPDMPLDQARAAADVARARRACGEDPRTCANSQSTVPTTFEPAARAWLDLRRAGWTPVHAADVLAALERDIFPAIGARPLAEIEPAEILVALRVVQARGAIPTARKLQLYVARAFACAISEGWTATNPAANVGEALAVADAVEHHHALGDIGELRQLLASIERVKAGPRAKRAVRLLALTAVRFAAVRFVVWSEIENLDGPAPMWRVPAGRMKLKASKKLDPANDHLVPLSPAAVAVLREARADLHGDDANSHDRLIFTGRDGRSAIGEKALSDLHVRAGYAGRHVPHGWRASFATILNEAMPAERGAIDRALGHAGGGKEEKDEGINRQVEGAYNRATHLPRRRALFDAWGEMLAPASAGPDDRN